MEPHRPSYRRVAWIIFLVIWSPFVGWRAWENYRFESATQAYSQGRAIADKQALARSERAFERISPIFRALPESEREPREKVEEALGLQPPVQQYARQNGQTGYIYYDPPTQGYVALSFTKGVWRGMEGPVYPPGGAYQVPKPTRDRFFATFEALRPWIAGWNRGLGPLVWLCLLVLLVFARGYRRTVSECLLAVAMICSAVWLLNPRYSLTWRGIASNDMLGWGVAMLCVSLLSLILTLIIGSMQSLSPHPECESCGYNLTGNVSGVCPECGEAITDNSSA